MIRTKKQRLMGEMLPRGYRVAYIDFARLAEVCYPIGLHLIARWLHRFWEWTMLYNPSKLENLIDAEARRRLPDMMQNRIRYLEEAIKQDDCGLCYRCHQRRSSRIIATLCERDEE